MTAQELTTPAAGNDALDLSPVVKKAEKKPVVFELIEVTAEEKGSINTAKVKIVAGDYTERYNAILKKLKRDVAINGFRQGKVPERMIRQMYGKGIEHQVAEDAMGEIVHKVAEEKKLRLVGTMGVKDVTVAADGSAEASYIFEIIPAISIPDEVLDSVAVTVEAKDVTDADIEGTIQRLLENNATFEAKDDSAAYAKGDGVILTLLTATASGRAISEESTHEEFLARPEELLPEEVIDALVGKKKGDTVTVTVAGKKAEGAAADAPAPEAKVYTATINGVKAKKLPALDDEFAKDVDAKFKTVDDLRTDVRRQLTERHEAKKRQDTFVAVYDKLVEKVPFEVPQTLIREALNNWVNRDEQMLRQQGTSLNAVFGKSLNTYYEAARLGAERGVKALLMARALSEQLGLTVTDEDLTAEYDRLGKEAGRSGLAMKAHHEARKTVDDVKQNLLRRKADEYLLKRVKVEYVSPKSA